MAHELWADDKFKSSNVWQFLKVLEFFNNYRKDYSDFLSEKIKEPLNQFSLEEFIQELEVVSKFSK